MRTFRICLLLAQACIGIPSFSQKNTEELVSASSVAVQPAGGHGILKKLPIRDLMIIDSRFDTTKIGYLKKGGSYKKISTGAPLRQTMQTFLAQQYSTLYDNASPYTLVLVVKNFWLQETSEAELLHRKIERSSENTATFSSCTATCEVYLANGSTYIPLFKRDSSYMESGGLKQNAESLLAKPFDDCLDKFASLDLSKIASAKRTLTWAEIEAFNQKRFQYPHFTATVKEKGIYKTFADFLQNNITKQDFVVEYGQHTDEVFTTSNGKPEALTDFWGICDGETFYMKVGYNIFELARQANTYDLWGSKFSIHKYSRYNPSSPGSVQQALLGSSLFNKNRIVTNAKPLQLNMETGTVY